MELRLKGFGVIEITNATRVEGGDILIEAADGFREIEKTTKYRIDKAELTKLYFDWSLVIWLAVPEENYDDDDAIVIDIEDQDDVYKLNAFL